MILAVVLSVATQTVVAPAPRSQAAPATRRVGSAAEFQLALAAAQPGTRLVVAPGEYGRVHATGVRGTSEQPIVITADAEGPRPVFRAGIQLSDVEHLVIERLEIAGSPTNGLNVDDAGTLETPSRHVVLRDLLVRDTGARGNQDGIKLSGLEDFRIERCSVTSWGRGGSAIDMVGCRRGLIVDCSFRDRDDDPAATGVQAKGGTRDVVIRSSRFEHAGRRAVHIGGSTALAYFRPEPQGFEAQGIVVEDCTFVGSEAPIAFTGCDGASVRANTFVHPQKWFLRILQETREPGFVPCRGGVFERNLIVWSTREIATPVNVGPHTAPQTFRFEHNYWYCADLPERSVPVLPVAEVEPVGGRDPRFRDASRGDYRLAADSPALGYGASPR
ncbi:MAG: right-handed parallel beta-helix repeat-containing protein [Planctomycetes bacterium]|nr:right-handed parallel beta-helix repeat-containing protein [Planctomycetota bacterium]